MRTQTIQRARGVGSAGSGASSARTRRSRQGVGASHDSRRKEAARPTGSARQVGAELRNEAEQSEELEYYDAETPDLEQVWQHARSVSVSRNFIERLGSMLRLDFYRLFHTPVFFIMVAISAIIPAMVLTLVGNGDVGTHAGTLSTGSRALAGASAAQPYTNTWQLLASIEPMYIVSDMGQYANINMVYIFGGILLAIFIGHDYTSGFVKSIFTSHSRKHDYILSKAAIGLFSTLCMIVAYMVGTVFAGILSGKSFAVDPVGLICCLAAHLVLAVGFSMLYTAIAVFFRRKFGIAIAACFFFGCGLPIMAAALAMGGGGAALNVFLYGSACSATLLSTPATVLSSLGVSLAWGAVYTLVITWILNRRDLA